MALPAITGAGAFDMLVDVGSDVVFPIAVTDSATGLPLDLLDVTGGTLYIHEGWDDRSEDTPPLRASVSVTVVDASAGSLSVSIPRAVTADLQARLPGREQISVTRDVPAYAYELEITDGTTVRRLLNGSFALNRRGARS